MNPDPGSAVVPPSRPTPDPWAEPIPWADLLEAAVTAMRDVRTMLFETNARAAVLTEALDELVGRIVDEHALEILAEDAIRAAGLDLRLERDPIDAGLLAERIPRHHDIGTAPALDVERLARAIADGLDAMDDEWIASELAETVAGIYAEKPG